MIIADLLSKCIKELKAFTERITTQNVSASCDGVFVIK